MELCHITAIPDIHHKKVLSYLDVLRDKKPIAQRVAIIGAGSLGFDIAIYLSRTLYKNYSTIEAFNRE